MRISRLSKEESIIYIIYKILFEVLEYNGEAADCTLLLECMKATKYRVNTIYKTK